MEHVRTWLTESWSLDPWENLALEECLLHRVGPREIGLFLWQNRNTVVIGRHQNPWKECRVELLEREDGRLARRLSGGGAVFHDLGNLNFTLVVDKALYDFGRQLHVLAQAAQKLGVKAEVSGRNDLLADGRKFSGNAYYRGRRADLHHGTVLVDVDLDRMLRYLQVSPGKLEGKGVTSVRSRVVNLRELNPSIDVARFKEALQEAFLEEYGGAGETFLPEEAVPREELEETRERYAGCPWRFGRTPKFSAAFERRFPWGHVELQLDVVEGTVRSCALFSDAMDADLLGDLPGVLEGHIFEPEALAKALEDAFGPEFPEEIRDMAEWFRVVFAPEPVA